MNPRDYNKSYFPPEQGMTFIPCPVDQVGRTTSSLKIRKTTKQKDSGKCIVKNCVSRVDLDLAGRSFHYFPSEEQPLRRNAWLRALNVNYVDSRSVICNLHFQNSDFIGPPSETVKFRVLRREAIPSFNLRLSEPGPAEVAATKYIPNEYFTNSDNNSVKTFCRCCLKLDAHSRDMKDTEMLLDGAKVNLYEAFFDCTSFKVLPGIDDHAQICLRCANSLELTIMFLSQCQSSNNMLSELFLNQEDPPETEEVDAEEEDDNDDNLLVPMKITYTMSEDISPATPKKPKIKTNIKAESIDIDYDDAIIRIQSSPPVASVSSSALTDSETETEMETLSQKSSQDIAEFITDELPRMGSLTMEKPKKVAVKKRGRPLGTKNSTGSNELLETQKTATASDTTSPAIVKRKYKKREYRNSNDVKSTRSSAKGLPAGNEYLQSQKKKFPEPETGPINVEEAVPTKKRKYQKTAPEPAASPAAQPANPEIRKPKNHEKKAYACTECNESFKLQVYLRYHQKSAHDNKNITSRQQKKMPFACLKCTKRFPTDEELLEHRQRAHKQTRKHTMPVFNCPTCEKSFGTQTALAWHQKEHKKEANRKHLRYECSMCTIGFFRQARMERHIEKVHHMELEKYEHKYRCQRCQVGFHVATSYYTHVKDCKRAKANELNDAVEKSNEKSNELEIPPSFFYCYNCKAAFLDKKYFDLHLGDCYTNIRLFVKCQLCRKEVHQIDCNFKWPRRTNYKEHLLKVHHVEYNESLHRPRRLSIEDEEEFHGF